MPNKFYHIKLVSGKEIYLNPERIVFATFDNKSREWELTVDSGFIFNFRAIDRCLDNASLAASFISKLPA